MYQALVTILFYILVSVCANNEFVVPSSVLSSNATLNIPFAVTWRCDDCGSNLVNLTLYQRRNDGNWAEKILLFNVANPGYYLWTPGALENLPIANAFHFNVRISSTLTFDSGVVFIKQAVSSSVASTSATATLSGTTAAASTTPASSATATPDADADATKKDQAQKVGLGVGLGLGIPIILVAGVLAAYKAFRGRAGARKEILDNRPDKKAVCLAPESQGPAAELHGDGGQHELPG